MRSAPLHAITSSASPRPVSPALASFGGLQRSPGLGRTGIAVALASVTLAFAACDTVQERTATLADTGGTETTGGSSGSTTSATGGSGSSATSGSSTSGSVTTGGATTMTSGGASSSASTTGASISTGSTGPAATTGSTSTSASTGMDAGRPDGGDAAVSLDRGPTPPTATSKFPFPQNRENSNCTYPTAYQNAHVRAAYDKWMADNVTTDGAKGFRRVKRSNEHSLDANSTVSEGIAYGLLVAVYMDDQSLFDDLWRYEQQNLDRYGFMNWYIKADGTGPASGGTGGATDADEDMAFALLMADKQWGGKGALAKNYVDFAKGLIGTIWANEILDYKFVKPGPWGDGTTINLSYFAPAYYKLFAIVDTANATNWKNTVDAMYGTLSASLNGTNGNTTNGLVPAWCDTVGKPNGGAFGPTGGPSPTNYQYDSCRTPFRIGLDWCWTGDTRAKDYVAKTSGFFSGITVAKMVDGYDLNGSAHAQFQTGANAQMRSAAFVGPAGVGAMSNATYKTFLDATYADVATLSLLIGGTYYDESWTVMSLLMMTGNFLDYTKY